MERLSAGDLTIDVEADLATRVVYRWLGRSTERNPADLLKPYFASVLGDAEARGLEVEMHFEKLEHFNSSTITALIRLIQEARGRGVKLVLVYDQSLKWQRLSFDALRVFDKNDQLFELRTVTA